MTEWLEVDEYAEYSVVGVSFYDQNFNSARQRLRAPIDSEHEVVVLLRHNPENLESETRTAVGVYFEGLHLGHVPQAASVIFVQDVLSKTGGMVNCTARIWFGPTMNSLRLRISWPPRLKGETATSSPRVLQGAGTYAVELQEKSFVPFHTITQHEFSNALIGQTIHRGQGSLLMGEFGREPIFDCIIGICSFRDQDVVQVQRQLNAIGGEALAYYQISKTDSQAVTVSIDWDLSVLQPSPYSNAMNEQDDFTVEAGKLDPTIGKSLKLTEATDKYTDWLEVAMKILGTAIKVTLLAIVAIISAGIGDGPKKRRRRNKW
jgi:hypothetical protein